MHLFLSLVLVAVVVSLAAGLFALARRIERLEHQCRQLWYIHQLDPDTVGVDQPDHH